ncbi:hypothetical protein TUMEXPCC7403_15670 [Tumidithrix helvetica PCC 7403]
MLVLTGLGVLKERYLYGANLDQVLAVEASSQVSWTLSDYLGTVRDLVSSAGVVQKHIKYDSFGNVTAQSAPLVKSRFGFTGREFDTETGLYYYRARYYDSAVGRFISEDPISFAGEDMNLCRYVGNDPMNGTDPFGHLVVADFSISRQTLTVIDLTTDRRVTVQAFSGYGIFQGAQFDSVPQAGAIPVGVYDILHFTPDPNWYRLDRRDSEPLNDRYDDSPLVPGVPRGQFRLHPGRVSLGCVTVPIGNVQDWSNLQSIINTTVTEIVEDRVGDGLGVVTGLRSLCGKKASTLRRKNVYR